jgi:hypothetical protein
MTNLRFSVSVKEEVICCELCQRINFMSKTPQQVLLQQIKDVLPTYRSLPDELADALQVSVDSAYRRIRGETKLTLDEAILLCERYQISASSLLPTNGALSFSYKEVSSEIEFQNYLSSFTATLDLTHKNNGELIYAGADVPLFHHFLLKEHAAFKIYYWLHAVLQSEDFRSKKFSPSLVSEKTLEISKDLQRAYQRINTTEIWSVGSATSTYKQILYCWEAGLFENKADAVLVTQQLLDILYQIREEADQRTAQPRKSLYCSEIEIGNNCVLVKNQGVSKVYLRHQTINTLVTSDEFFCNETDAFLQQLIKRSVLISESAAKQRHQFFQQLISPVEGLLKQIELNG